MLWLRTVHKGYLHGSLAIFSGQFAAFPVNPEPERAIRHPEIDRLNRQFATMEQTVLRLNAQQGFLTSMIG